MVGVLKMTKIVRTRRSERGATTILFTLVFVFMLLPMTGLAVDSAIAFVIKTKLSAAVDGAVLAAAGSLNIGLDANAQKDSAIATAQAYFTANFPPELMNAQANLVIDPNANPVQDNPQTQVRTVTLQATAVAPLYFMSIFGAKNITVAASGQASRRDVNVVMVLDRSGSMATSKVCGTMIASAQSFVNKFANGRDRVSLITFKGSAETDFPDPTKGQTSLQFQPGVDNEIKLLQCAGNTGSAEALTLAHRQFLDPTSNKLIYPGALNVIVFFTDGQPNGVSGYYPIKTGSKCVPTPQNPYLEGFLSQGPAGVYSTAPVPISNTSEKVIATPAGCSFEPNSAGNVAKDVAYLATQQVEPNSLTPLMSNAWQDEYGDVISPGYYSLPKPPAQIPVNNTTVTYASWNAADDAANRVRQDKIVIYCIGESKSVDAVFLKRVANTPDSSSFNPSQPTGLYVYSPDGSQLSSAFDTIASQILHISQ